MAHRFKTKPLHAQTNPTPFGSSERFTTPSKGDMHDDNDASSATGEIDTVSTAVPKQLAHTPSEKTHPPAKSDPHAAGRPGGSGHNVNPPLSPLEEKRKLGDIRRRADQHRALPVARAKGTRVTKTKQKAKKKGKKECNGTDN